jgi:hypothetical protein
VPAFSASSTIATVGLEAAIDEAEEGPAEASNDDDGRGMAFTFIETFLGAIWIHFRRDFSKLH